MGKLVSIVLIGCIATIGYVMQKRLNVEPFDTTASLQYFGPGAPKRDSVNVVPYRVAISNQTLVDLNERLSKFELKFNSLEDSSNFKYGFNTQFLTEVVQYWRTEYDWRKFERQLNNVPQFQTQIAGMNVHFLHAKPPTGKYAQTLPLLLTHGWPGSVYEFYKIIPMLIDPASAFKSHGNQFAFEVIAPSIPGYGFSDAPRKTGFGCIQAALVFGELMQRLGFNRYFVQGGDWGSLINTNVALLYPDRVIGAHLNMASPSNSDFMVHVKRLLGMIVPSLVFEPADIPKVYPVTAHLQLLLQESGYFHIQATKPDTVGIALSDSPVGLMAYILEKFSTWTNPAYRALSDGGLKRHWSLDELLTNIMVYWTTGTIATSQRFYKETFGEDLFWSFEAAPLTVPTGIAVFPNELMRFPRSMLVNKYTNITQYTDMLRGGHFAAFEEPKLLAMDILSFAMPLAHQEKNS